MEKQENKTNIMGYIYLFRTFVKIKDKIMIEINVMRLLLLYGINVYCHDILDLLLFYSTECTNNLKNFCYFYNEITYLKKRILIENFIYFLYNINIYFILKRNIISRLYK